MADQYYLTLLERLEPGFKLAVWSLAKSFKQLDSAHLGEAFEFKYSDKTDLSIEEQKLAVTFLLKTGVIAIPTDQLATPPGCIRISGTSYLDSDQVGIWFNEKRFPAFYDALQSILEPVEVRPNNTYSLETGTLTINGKSVRFRKDRSSHTMLSVLFTLEDDFYKPGKTIDYGTINEIARNIDETLVLLPKPKTLYGTRENINKAVSEETGFEGLILLDNGLLRLNPDAIKKEG